MGFGKIKPKLRRKYAGEGSNTQKCKFQDEKKMSGKMDKLKKRIFTRNGLKGKGKMMWVKMNVSNLKRNAQIK